MHCLAAGDQLYLISVKISHIKSELPKALKNIKSKKQTKKMTFPFAKKDLRCILVAFYKQLPA